MVEEIIEEPMPEEEVEVVPESQEPHYDFTEMALVVTIVHKNIPILYEWLPKNEAYKKAKELMGVDDAIQIQ